MTSAATIAPNSVLILPARLDWPSAIGLFIMNFGVLDYRMFEFLNHRLPPAEFVKLREKGFADRIIRIAAYLKDQEYPTEQCAAFDHFAERIEPIRELRNHIAHSYMLCRFDCGTQPVFTLCRTKDLYIEHLPTALRLDLNGLNEACATVCELIEEFDRVTG